MSNNSNAVQARSLWMGDIDTWMNEDFIKQIFKDFEVRNVKIIRDKTKPNGTGYSFVEFDKIEQADMALQNLNGKNIPNTAKIIKLNWASYSASKTLSTNTGGTLSDHTIYVADLDLSVSEETLKNFFSNYYNSVTGAKIIIDPSSKVSKGYGFVKFSDLKEYQKSLAEMNGKILNGKAIKTNQASFKKMNPDFGTTTSKTNNYYKYNQQGYSGVAQNSYGVQSGVYGSSYPGYYDQYSAYNYQPYYNQNLSNQYVYPYNYPTQVQGFDQNSQYQQLLLQSLATNQQGYTQGSVPQVANQSPDLTAQYQTQMTAAGYPTGYGYDYTQTMNMYQMNPQVQMQMQMGQINPEVDNKKISEEKK